MTVFEKIAITLHWAIIILVSYGSYAQNLIPNSTLDTFTVYRSNRLNGQNFIYPDHWFQISYSNFSLYCYESLHPGSLLNMFYYFNVEPEELTRNKGCMRVELDPQPDLVYSKLRNPLKRETEYYFRMSVLLSTIFPEILTFPIRFQKEKPNIAIQQEISILLSIPDTSQIKLKNNHWITLEGKYKARGGEEYFILGTKDKKYYVHQFSDSIKKKYVDYKTNHLITYYDKDDIEFYSLVNVMLVDSLVLNPISLNEKPISKENIVRFPTKNDTNNLDRIISVYFSPDQFSISDSAKKELKDFVSFCSIVPSVNILVNGYTDNRDNEEYNSSLSMKRAHAVADFLVFSGITIERIKVSGHGMRNPKYSNSSANGRNRNRRVDVIIDQKNLKY
jgi:outer membrane protein OmpA-like peptidoglycan-associated protein